MNFPSLSTVKFLTFAAATINADWCPLKFSSCSNDFHDMDYNGPTLFLASCMKVVDINRCRSFNRALCFKSSFAYVPKIQFIGLAISFRPFYVTHSKHASSRYVNIKEGVFKKAWNYIKYYTVEKTRKRVIGYYLYETIADKVNYLSFFKEMEMPDTFNSWFLVTELHVWMLMVKAMEVGGDGRLIRNFIVEAMWQDVSIKGKKLGPENISRAKEQVLVLGDQFQAALIAYDEGMLSNDKVLASALWRRFFERSCDNPERLETMVQYIRKQMQCLDILSQDDFKNRNITWISLNQRKQ